MKAIHIMKIITANLLAGIAGLFILQCSQNASDGTVQSLASAQVQVSSVQRAAISDSVLLSATSYFPEKNDISAPITGYILNSQVRPGMQVKAGAPLFTLQTREASTLSSIPPDSILDTSGDFGTVTITAMTNGGVVSISHFSGDYVQEGMHLCTIVQPENLSFKLYAPYRYHNLVTSGQRIRVILPDDRKLWTRVNQQLSLADSSSQSSVYLLTPEEPVVLPEGLRANAILITAQQDSAQLVPKDAILSNETMDSFWIMTVVNDTLALRVPIERGITNNQYVEIKNPIFSATDRIIVSGNYGLEDSARVSIIE